MFKSFTIVRNYFILCLLQRIYDTLNTPSIPSLNNTGVQVRIEIILTFNDTLSHSPESFCQDNVVSGTFYLVDSARHLVLQAKSFKNSTRDSGYIRKIAGIDGVSGFENGNALTGTLNGPMGIACTSDDRNGSLLLISDTKNNALRKIDLRDLGHNLFMTTFAGSLANGLRDAQGSYARFSGPTGLTLDVSGSRDFYLADSMNNAIRRITINAKTSLMAGNGVAGYIDQAKTNAMFNNPRGVAYDPHNMMIYVADTGNHVIRRVSQEGLVTTLAGSGKPGFSDGIDQGNYAVRKVRHDGTVVTLISGSQFGKIVCLIGEGKESSNLYLLDTALVDGTTGSRFHTIKKLTIEELNNDDDDEEDDDDGSFSNVSPNLLTLVVYSIVATCGTVAIVVVGTVCRKLYYERRFRDARTDGDDELARITMGVGQNETVDNDETVIRPPQEDPSEVLPPYTPRDDPGLSYHRDDNEAGVNDHDFGDQDPLTGRHL